jgi:predicted SAM-dependent methyltransferase/glycosyltransferase involved in cell wall biosynthesis
MKVALIFGPFSVSPRPLTLFADKVWTSSRGLSGSDLAVVMTAKLLAQRGHDVSLFTFFVPHTKPIQWEGVKLYHYEERTTIIDQSFDALISWNEPDVFRGLPTNKVRICHQLLNDFPYCQPNFDDFVDIWASPSEMHLQWMQKYVPSSKWQVLPLGTDPSWFTQSEKVPGSVIWLSSPDRGLHLLLQEWPKIKQTVPEATLKVFYHLSEGTTGEVGKRIQYIKYAIPKLKEYGVSHTGSVSRQQIAQELSQAMIVISPLSTVSPTEGFSCVTMEACAAGCLPIIGNIDCLGSIYGSVACIIPALVEQHLGELRDSIIRGLKDTTWRQQIIQKCQKFADGYTWQKNVEKLENLIVHHPKFQGQVSDVSATTNHQLVKLNIGAGSNMFAHDGWIHYDREDMKYLLDYLLNVPSKTALFHGYQKISDYLKKGGKMDLRVQDLRQGFSQHSDNSVDLVYLGQVIEHLNPIFEVPKILKECHRLLKPGGVLRMTTPDLDILVEAYQNGEMDKFIGDQPPFYQDADPSSQLSYLMFGSSGEKCTWDHYEGHFFLFSRNSMRLFLQKAGFQNIVFYDEPGRSLNPIMAQEVIDMGISHSLIVEAKK